jgi:hypothetical protein
MFANPQVQAWAELVFSLTFAIIFATLLWHLLVKFLDQ